ncbi:nuclease-related domain-containing protein [Micromonospora sp. WMMD1102]|nr:nuclease-related domain-containing protein [Micromonospora sp. WMMD1102]MDG4785698.1 nuclease-related domain-containing protein [Micromonospora sp. WMMD1102]MDG4792173.1 nuclease-related domain-containing protein [Micromonospora sp. WMMD1102]
MLTRSGLYVVELKHWQGVIEGSGTHWTRQLPNGRTFPEDNPYILANRKAKRLASLIKHYAPRNAQVPYVGAIVFLHARHEDRGRAPAGPRFRCSPRRTAG